MSGTPPFPTAQMVVALIEYHNRPTAFGWFRKIDRPGFHLQQLPLSEVNFAILMNDFFATFEVCPKHYDDTRYFPARRPLNTRLACWIRGSTAGPYQPLTIAMLCEAAWAGCWPEETY